MSDPVQAILNEFIGADAAEKIVDAIPPSLALGVYYALEQRFGYTSAMWDRESIENMAGRDLTDAEWKLVTDSEWWDHLITDVAYDAVRDASSISLMLADLNIL